MVRLAGVWAIAISCIPLSTALKCYGADAFQRSLNGERDCYRHVDGGFWNPCWSKCGGVTLFMDSGDDDPNGKELCPYKANRRPGYSFGSLDFMPCNCSMWRQPLPAGKCPKCDDFNAIPPLMMTTSRDAVNAGIELGTCPPGYDTCFNYCVNGDDERQEFQNECAYGCAKIASKPILHLLIATKLMELDQRKLEEGMNSGNPIEYVCEGWADECTQTFCHADGCNQLAPVPKLRGWKQVYRVRWINYALIFFACILAFCVLACGLHSEREQYVPI